MSRHFWRRRGQLHPWSKSIDEKYLSYAQLIARATRMDGSRYRRFGRAHMFWHRTTGLIEIVLSVSFPFVVSSLDLFEETPPLYKNLLVSGISVAIALAAGLRAFYSWSDNWRLYRTQWDALDSVILNWELGMLAAIQDAGEGDARALEVTRKALDKIGRLREHEQDTFFGTMRLPADILPEKRDGLVAAKAG